MFIKQWLVQEALQAARLAAVVRPWVEAERLEAEVDCWQRLQDWRPEIVVFGILETAGAAIVAFELVWLAALTSIVGKTADNTA